MSLKLKEFAPLRAGTNVDAKKRGLLERHQSDIARVVREARSLSQDSERTLRGIKDKDLRNAAKR
jgi:hypothetical protein